MSWESVDGGIVSRARNARRKAKRQQAQAAAESAVQSRSALSRRRLMTLVPVLVIAAVFALVAVLGFGASSGKSQQQVRQEVDALLADLPQDGSTLGSPEAPVTIWMFGDLECPTVRLFVENYLPAFLDTWVRTGDVKLIYRSLETDTYNEEVFFEQEIAALAAGRQDRMWNFLLTFIHRQQEDYATDEFLAEIASQVLDLDRAQWRRDREDALLSKDVALDVYSAHRKKLSSTPSFLIGLSDRTGQGDGASLRDEVETSLRGHIDSLSKEAAKDIPSVSPLNPAANGRLGSELTR
jgi:protein-disulfide isomerase